MTLEDLSAVVIAADIAANNFEAFVDETDREATLSNITENDIANAQSNIDEFVHYYSYAEQGIHDSLFGQLVHAVKVSCPICEVPYNRVHL